MNERMPRFIKEAGMVAAVAAGLAGEAHAQEAPDAAREQAELTAYRGVENNRDSQNREYMPVPKGEGVIELQSLRNDTLNRDGQTVANAPEMQLELHGETWRMVPKSDSFAWLAAEAHVTFEGLSVDPNDKASLNAAINTVIGMDAVLDRYMASAGAEKNTTNTVESDPFASMLDKKLHAGITSEAIADALAYVKTAGLLAE